MNLLIYNPAALHGGAAAILNRFIEDIARDTANRYWVVVGSEAEQVVRVPAPHIRYIEISRSYRSRLKWLYGELAPAIRQHGIDAVLSLENTCNLLLRSTPQYVYLHQSLQFAPNDVLSWKLRLKIKWLNGFLIKRSCRKAAGVFVQTRWMKEAVAGEYGVDSNRVAVIPPKVAHAARGTVNEAVVEKLAARKRGGQLVGVSVTSPDRYKNVETLVRFVAAHNRTSPGRSVCLAITFASDANGYARSLATLAESLGAADDVLFVGRVSPATLEQVYELADAAFCSSAVESLGLPLVEAMSRGLKLYAPDLPYVRDVCGDYAETYRYADEGALLARFRGADAARTPVRDPYRGESFLKLIDWIRKTETGSVECAELL